MDYEGEWSIPCNERNNSLISCEYRETEMTRKVSLEILLNNATVDLIFVGKQCKRDLNKHFLYLKV